MLLLKGCDWSIRPRRSRALARSPLEQGRHTLHVARHVADRAACNVGAGECNTGAFRIGRALRHLLTHPTICSAHHRHVYEHSDETHSAVARYLVDGLTHVAQGRTTEALDLYATAVALEPGNAPAQHQYGRLLYDVNRFEDAALHLERALALAPESSTIHHDLGDTLWMLDRFDEAEPCYRSAFALDPSCIDAANNLGILLSKRGQYVQAEQLLRGLIQASPSFVPARQNLAQVYVASGRMQDAARECTLGLAMDPGNSGFRQLLGVTYGALGQVAEARAHFAAWYADDPTNEHARHHHAAYSGEATPEVASPAYVRQAFDPFAMDFESKLAALDYRAPTLVGDALSAVLGAPSAHWRIADAGCGTGLCAPYLRPHAQSLVGVDLSRPMLDQADAKQLYDELHEDELVQFFEARPTAFDAIVSADTLCYFGVLEGFTRAARSSLEDTGWLIFTVEALTDDADTPWRLQHHGRYCHQRSYVESTLMANGFRVHGTKEVVLRIEAGRPVTGWLVTAAAC